MKISVIGAGNMAGAVAEGLQKSKVLPAENIFVTRRSLEKLSKYKDMGMQISTDNQAAAEFGDYLLFGTKPWDIKEAILPLKSKIEEKKPVLIFVIAGLKPEEVQSWFDVELPIFVCMPNTAIAVGKSVVGIQSINSTEDQQKQVNSLFDPLGLSIPVTAKQMRAITVLSGSGTAFVMRFIRAYSNAAIEHGFKPQQALEMTLMLVEGTVKLLQSTGQHPESEIDRVTTPGGCTIAGLNEMEKAGFSQSVFRTIDAGVNRVAEMEKEN